MNVDTDTDADANTEGYQGRGLDSSAVMCCAVQGIGGAVSLAQLCDSPSWK
jgi:hypothetical protein